MANNFLMANRSWCAALNHIFTWVLFLNQVPRAFVSFSITRLVWPLCLKLCLERVASSLIPLSSDHFSSSSSNDIVLYSIVFRVPCKSVFQLCVPVCALLGCFNCLFRCIQVSLSCLFIILLLFAFYFSQF